MFTGLVEARGTVSGLVDDPPACRLEIGVGEAWAGEASVGDSVAINGCCLTVVEIGAATLWFEAGPETLARTNLGELVPGAPVNLERPLAAGDGWEDTLFRAMLTARPASSMSVGMVSG